MEAQTAPPDSALQPIDPSLRIASVHLGVGELPRSVSFYEHAVGLPVISQDEDGARLGSEAGAPALVLTRIEQPQPAPPRSTGLFHVAWLHPTRRDLAATIERAVRARWPIHGASDHGVSEALYLSDPDGLGVEVYADRPREQWRHLPSGELEMVTLPLDVDDLLAQAPLEEVPAMPGAAALGHIHLKVSDVGRAAGFYRDTLGFEEQAHMPSAAFLAAGGYHHHIGLNSWQSRGAGPPSERAPGLREVVFELGDAGALEQLQRRLATAGQQLEAEPGRLHLRDPDGHRLTFAARARG
jgi:catechol 2,3-dioxygenase